VSAKRRSKAVLEAENRYLRKRSLVDATASVINNLIRWGGLVVLGYFAVRITEELSGGVTTANLGLTLVTDVRISTVAAWALAFASVTYGWGQRRLRRDTVERLAGRIRELERAYDPRRTSSRLTSRGDTHPGDEP
jgi:hypothetical protein